MLGSFINLKEEILDGSLLFYDILLDSIKHFVAQVIDLINGIVPSGETRSAYLEWFREMQETLPLIEKAARKVIDYACSVIKSDDIGPLIQSLFVGLETKLYTTHQLADQAILVCAKEPNIPTNKFPTQIAMQSCHH
jgi:hypothetical protein